VNMNAIRRRDIGRLGMCVPRLLRDASAVQLTQDRSPGRALPTGSESSHPCSYRALLTILHSSLCDGHSLR
jgi:hypothetical protein